MSSSGLKKALHPFANLFVGEVIAVLKGGLAVFYGFDEAVFLFEVPRNNILHNLVGVASLSGRSLDEPGLQVRGEMYFHDSQARRKLALRQRQKTHESGSVRLNDVHPCAISEARPVAFAIFPGEAEFAYVGEPEPACDVADRVEISIIELFVHHGVLSPVHQRCPGDAMLKIVAELGRYPKCALRNRPVCDALHRATSSGVPATTTSPPA